MASKLFACAEQFIMDTFLIKLAQFEETGSIGKKLYFAGSLITYLHIHTSSRSRFSWPLHFLCSIEEFAFH